MRYTQNLKVQLLQSIESRQVVPALKLRLQLSSECLGVGPRLLLLCGDRMPSQLDLCPHSTDASFMIPALARQGPWTAEEGVFIDDGSQMTA